MKTEASFWDTSVLLTLACQQNLSKQARQLWRKASRVVVWWGTPVEMRSAISRLERQGHLTTQELQFALRRQEAMRDQWREIAPSDKLRDLAETLPDTYGLLTLDALQLAAALVWCKEKPKGRVFICADRDLANAAQRAGFTILNSLLPP
jgi:predicted nucleic acid-binding protein